MATQTGSYDFMAAKTAAETSKVTRSASGQRTIVADDAAELPLITIDAYGESVQDGTPTPSNPVPIITVKSLVWNQLVQSMSTSTDDGITTAYDSTTGLFSITNNSRTTNYGSGSTRRIIVSNLVIGHKYYIGGNLITGVGVLIDNVTGTLYQPGSIVSVAYGSTFKLRVTKAYDFVSTHPIGDVTTFHLFVCDLTLMYGAGNEPTVEEFEAKYPDDYYPYDAGNNLFGISVGGGLTSIDLQGNVLASLPDGTRDVLTVDSTGHCVLEKRVTFANPKEAISIGSSSGNQYVATRATVAGTPTTTNENNIIGNRGVAARNAANVGNMYVTSAGNTIVLVFANNTFASVAEASAWLQANDTYFYYELATPQTIGLGYIDMPAIPDGSTVHVVAEVQPVIDASWWTKAGEAAGKAHGDSNRAIAEAQQEAAEAAKVAGNYIWESALNDMWLHSEDHGPDTDPNSQTYGQATEDTYGWRIGSVFELVRAGLSYFKMWVENSVAKLRLGLDTSGHVLLDSTGMEVMSSTTSLAKFGSTARVGAITAGNVRTTSDGIGFYDKDDCIGSISMRAADDYPKFWTAEYMPNNQNPSDISFVRFGPYPDLIEFTLIDSAIGNDWSNAYFIACYRDNSNNSLYLLVKASTLAALMPSGATMSDCKLYANVNWNDLSSTALGVFRNGTYLQTTTAPYAMYPVLMGRNMVIDANVVVNDFECSKFNGFSPALISVEGHKHDASDINSGVFDKARLQNVAWTYAAGSNSASFYVRWCKVAHIVHVEVYGSKSLASSTSTTLSTTAISTGNRPSKEVDAFLYSSKSNAGCLWVDSSGNVKGRVVGAAASAVYGSLSYPVF